MEKNTPNVSLKYPGIYLSGLVELDYYKDEQELISAQFQLDIKPDNHYWKSRVKHLKEKIEIKKQVEAALKVEGFNLKTEQSNTFTTEEVKQLIEEQIKICAAAAKIKVLAAVHQEIIEDYAEVDREFILNCTRVELK